MRLWVLGFSGWLAAATASAQVSSIAPPVRDTRPPAIGTASIAGRVVDAQTGGPLRRATVRIMSPAIRESRSITTDNDGRYFFPNLPAGRYQLSAARDGYVSAQYGGASTLEPGKPINLVDRQAATDIDFRLPRGGVITGLVVDEFGEPMSGVNVTSLVYRFAQQGRQAVPAGRGAMTNDIGEFRLYGLAPGDYLVSAAPQRFTNQDVSLDQAAPTTTYYPSTTDDSQAQTIRVEAAQTLSGMTIVLSSARVARISGVVVDSNGQAPAGPGGAVTALSRSRLRSFSTISGIIRPGGEFILSSVPPGSYVLRANVGIPGQSPFTAVGYVDINGGDVTNVRLAPEVPVNVRGRLIADPPSAPGLRLQNLRPTLVPLDPTDFMASMPGSASPTTSDDGSFAIKGRPGRMALMVNLPPTWMVRRVVLNGRDVTDGIDLSTGDVDDLQVEMTNRIGQITGRVLTSRGEVVDTCTVLSFPQDRERWRENVIRPIARPDETGKFTLRPLHPGDYYVVAVDRVEPGRWYDPDFLETLRPLATALTIGEGETRAIDLKLTQPR